MLKTWWRIIRTAIGVIGVLLTFFAVIEAIRAYQTLRDFHPIAGYIFVGVLACLGIWLIGYILATLGSRPAVLVPPVIPSPDEATERQLRRYGKYLGKYIDRLSDNPSLSTDDRAKAEEGGEELADALASARTNEAILAAIGQAESNIIQPLLAKLSKQADKEIRASVAIVMAGVALSPYKAADLMIVVYRNVVMVIRTIRIYNSRPRFGEQLRILSDIVNVVATVNYINMGQNLIDGLFSNVPGIGRFTDDIAQGIGAGFMTSVVGHAAMQRCEAFKGWNEQEAKDTLRSRAGDFYADVRDMFKKDILPKILKRFGDSSRDTMEKIGQVLDDIGGRVGTFVKAPFSAAISATSTVVTAGGKVTARSRRRLRVIKRLFRRKKRG